MTGLQRRCVLLFSGADPSGGAGTHADAQAIAALGAHPLPVITALTVQDNDRVHAVHTVASGVVEEQARALLAKIEISAVKIGVIGSAENARAIAALVMEARRRMPELPVVLDPVLASGHGDPLARGNAIAQMATLLPLADLVTPNLPEAAALGGDDGMRGPDAQAASLLRRGCANVLIKGGHGGGDEVVNRWYTLEGTRDWKWPRRSGAFHGSGCTLASAIAALLAQGATMADALERGQAYCQRAIEGAYPIADGQWMLARCRPPG